VSINCEGIEYRRMVLDDLPEVLRIDRESFSLPWSERAYRFEINQNPAANMWTATANSPEGERVIGFLGFWLILDEAHISTLAVDEECRRNGIAEQLIRVGLSSVRKKGVIQVLLEVRKSNVAAIKLYKKLGFEVVGIRSKYYSDNREDALLMTLFDFDRVWYHAPEVQDE
jgi:[ribosomal protein S18]-alanine N-acetyltransferase